MRGLLVALLLLVPPVDALAVDVPDPGQCPPYPVTPGTEAGTGQDPLPPAFREGETIELEGAERLRNYLPREVWEHRLQFFHEGMTMEIGPCHRRYPAPDFFREATAENGATTHLDAEGNLEGFPGTGLPFPWREIADDDPQAGWKWAWNYRYRYQGSGFRGDFRILEVARRGRSVTRYRGRFYLLPLHGVPGHEREASEARFWAGGSFQEPAVARGIAWRQIHPAEADRKPDLSDEIFVWVPEERRVRRAAPTAVDGLFLPSYQRGNTAGWGKLVLPDGIQTPDPSIGVTEHTRRGFTGLLLRPNAYRFHLLRVQDVIAPINARLLGYPADENRSYGTSGISLASDRWEIRRAVVLKGTRKKTVGRVASVTLYIDALTQQPLYMITHRPNGHLREIGMFLGRFSADDPLHPHWQGSDGRTGVILPSAASFYVAGEGGWLRESFSLRSDPPTDQEASGMTTTIRLQRGR